jgi:hypothetical protein
MGDWFKDFVLSVVGIMILIVFQFIVLSSTDPTTANTDPTQVLRIYGDLWVAALGLIMGAFWAAEAEKKRSALTLGYIFLIGSILLILGSVLVSARTWSFAQNNTKWLSLWIPDALAAIAFLMCVRVAQKARP